MRAADQQAADEQAVDPQAASVRGASGQRAILPPIRAQLKLYAVTDSRWVGDMRKLPNQVRLALEGGATMIQFREKHDRGTDTTTVAREIAGVCRVRGIPFIVNDSLALALESGADGLHVGQGDENLGMLANRMPESMILGVSVSTVRQALIAEAAGADYLGVGAVFPTATKTDAAAVSRETLAAICRAVSIPVVAIGGIDETTLSALAGTGIAGAAVISAIFANPDRVRENTASLRAAADRISFAADHPVTALSIAGSDPVGGAGIQGDLKTFQYHGAHGMAVITSAIAQNTTGVHSSAPVSARLIEDQLKAVFTDILPDAVKIGLVPNREAALAIARVLDRHKTPFVVADPVLSASSGENLTSIDPQTHRDNFLSLIAPRSALITPNLAEASILAGHPVITRADMSRAAVEIRNLCGGKTAVLIKGGHLDNREDAADCLARDEGFTWFEERRIAGPACRGTGCALSSALAVLLAKGQPMDFAVKNAKAALSRRIAAARSIGRGAAFLGGSDF